MTSTVPPTPTCHLASVGGLTAGRRWALPSGRSSAGRQPDCTVVLDASSVSRRHASFEQGRLGVTVHDLASRNGTWLDGVAVTGSRRVEPDQVIRLGAVAVAVRPGPPAAIDWPAAGSPTADSGAQAFNRPPRSLTLATAPEVPVPSPPAVDGRGRAPLSIAMLLAPLAFAAVSMVLFSPVMAVFALMGPALMGASWAEHRLRDRRGHRRSAARQLHDLAAFEAALGVRHRHDLDVQRRQRPDPAHLLEQAARGAPNLWERRLDHPDAMQVVVGLADMAWRPDLDGDLASDERLGALVDACGPLREAPVTVDLGAGHVVGLAGPGSAAAAVARSLVIQIALLHGPADVEVVIVDDECTAPRWQCLLPLPHRRAEHAGPRRDRSGGPIELVIVDVAARRLAGGMLTRLLAAPGGGVAAIVLADHPHQLPACCTSVVELLDADGDALVRWPTTGETIRPLLATGVDEATLLSGSTLLGQRSDPDRVDGSAGLPDRVDLDDLRAGPDADPTVERTTERWARSARHPEQLQVVIGARVGDGADGPPRPFTVDLAADGPHMLIGGTTGSGKSELLRTLVLGLALDHSPLDLTFVLVDYKGGSAFDACADLPHTVGFVTDLDEHLGARALASLDAEIRRREHLLRAAGATDLATYRRTAATTDPNAPPLPRLVVIIDEFATLAAELPAFLDALVGVAQRGRSLGVHLVLATQRPHGAVNDRIRTNTNLRIALRMLDRADSADVIDDPIAATIPRHRPGRAAARLGHDELIEFQTALVSPERLTTLVDQIIGSAAGLPLAPAPWLPPLPDTVTRETLGAIGALEAIDAVEAVDDDGQARVVVALADEPEHQRQRTWAWHPHRGNLLVYGMPGSGTTTALVAVGLAATVHRSPSQVHLYGIADARGRLSALGGLPHTGSIVAADDLARQARLIRRLADELDGRRQASASTRRPRPVIVTLIDDLPGLLGRFDTLAGQQVVTDLTRVFRDGPAVDVHLAVAGDRPGSIPVALAARTTERLVLHLSDPYDLTTLGLQHRAGRGPTPPPGRGWVGQGAGTEVQVAAATDVDVQRVARRYPPTDDDTWARPVGELAVAVPIDHLGAAELRDGRLVLPIGIVDRTLESGALVLHAGDHGLVMGPPKSGRSTTLCTLARTALAAEERHGTPMAVIALAGRASPLTDMAGITVVGSIRSLLRATAELGAATAVLVLVDDADTVTDPNGALAALTAVGSSHVHVVAAGRADRLRTNYSHWTFGLRSSRAGLALRPDPELDGDPWGIRLPRQTTASFPPGRGYLVVDGEIELIQVAAATHPDRATT